MNMYKKAYRILFEGISEALAKADEEIKQEEGFCSRGKQYEIYGILSHAQRRAEEEILEQEEEI